MPEIKLRQMVDRYFFFVLLIPLSFIAYPLLGEGMVINEDWLLAEGNAGPWIWIEKGSYASFDTIQRLPIVAFWFLLSSINFSYELIGKVMIISGFLLAAFSFYFAFQLLFRKWISSTPLLMKIASAVGSMFFTFNIWSFIRISHWYLWISYAVLPLFIVSLVYCFNNPKKWRYLIITVLLWSFASTTPFMVVLYSIIFICTLLFFILHKSIRRQKITNLGIPFLTVIFLYIVINLYWIYPYFQSLETSSYEMGPYYVLSSEIGELLSNDNDFLSTLRLTGDWTNLQQTEPPTASSLYSLWVVASLVVPVVAVAALLSQRDFKYALPFLFLVIIGVLLAMGTQSPTNYYNLIFSIPLGWLFRDPNKWSLLIALGFSFLLGMSTLKILTIDFGRLNNKRNLVAACYITIVLFSIALTSYPIYLNTLGDEGSLSPIAIPDEFERLNKYLSDVPSQKVFFLPYPAASTNWSNGHVIGSLYQLSSVKSSIDAGNPTFSDPSRRNYYNFLINDVIENRSRNIQNFINPFGTSYLVFHDDGLDIVKNRDILNRMNNLEDLNHLANIGFFKIFKLDHNSSIQSPQQFNILNDNIQIVQSLDKLTFLNSIPSFSTLNSSLLFLDQAITKDKKDQVNEGDTLILEGSSNNFVFSFITDKYVVQPFVASTHYDPSSVWSRAGVLDPLHGEYHPYLENELGIENWDFDYGKGIVMTKGTGANLSIPFEVDNTTNYDVLVRYLKNQRGGELKIYLDNKLIENVNSMDRKSNDFAWRNIMSDIRLSEGKHTLKLENSFGFNAVNIFAILPVNETSKLINDANSLANKMNNIYLLEAFSDFEVEVNENNASVSHLFNIDKKRDYDENSTYDRLPETITGSFTVPEGANYMYLDLISKESSQTPSSYAVTDIEITPFKRVLVTDLVGSNEWHSGNNETVSSLIPGGSAATRDKNLFVKVEQSNTTSNWNTIYTDLLPVDFNAFYNYSIDTATLNVNQFHGKIRYYDSERNFIREAYLFTGLDGTSETRLSGSIVPPLGTQYMMIEILSMPNANSDSYYLIDNLTLNELQPSSIFKNNFDRFENLDSEELVLASRSESAETPGTESLSVTHVENSSRNESGIRSEPFPVRGGFTYNYSMTIETNNIDSINAYMSTINNEEITSRSRDNILTLVPGSSIYTELDILKHSNYDIAVRANTCATCSPLNVSMQDQNGNYVANGSNISRNEDLTADDTKLTWFYLRDIKLQPGHYTLRINANSETELDSVIIYSSGGNSILKGGEGTRTGFNESSIKPFVSEYKKINPTKYIVSISNATKPFMLSFAESFDPLWSARVETNGTNNDVEDSSIVYQSVPLYSLINGYYIDKPGDYDVVIEYKPHQWFVKGGIASAIILTIFIAMFLIIKKYQNPINELRSVFRIKRLNKTYDS